MKFFVQALKIGAKVAQFPILWGSFARVFLSLAGEPGRLGDGLVAFTVHLVLLLANSCDVRTVSYSHSHSLMS